MSARRAERGHVLVEVMLSAAVVVLITTGLVAALLHGSRDVNRGAHDQMAAQLAQQQLELFKQQPTASWAANAGSGAATSSCAAAGLPSCSMTVTWPAAAVDAYSAVPAGVLLPTLYAVQVAVSYCEGAPCVDHTRTVTLGAIRGQDP